jgi:hypothetical protein
VGLPSASPWADTGLCRQSGTPSAPCHASDSSCTPADPPAQEGRILPPLTKAHAVLTWLPGSLRPPALLLWWPSSPRPAQAPLLRSAASPQVLGKRLGKQMGAVAAATRALTGEDILTYEATGKLTVGGVELGPGDLKILRDFKPPEGTSPGG